MQVLQSPSLGGGAASAAGSSRSGAGDGALSTPPPLHSSLVKCKVTRCPKYAPDRPMLTCDAAGCEKEVHDQCYIRIAEKSTTVQPLENHRFCTITCQKKYEHQADPALNWTNDGRNGPQDPHTSQFYLLQWLNNEDHYNTWRDPGDGITKKELAENIGRMIKGHGVQRELGGPVVKAKIETIFKSMKEAYDFENSDTGQGILEEIGEASFREKVRDVCSFYYDLKDVFVSRAGVRPKETTATLYNNSSFTDSDDTDSSEESTSTGSEESGAPQGSAAAETEMGDVALSASNASDMAGGDGVGAVEADEAMPYVCDAAEHGDEVAKLMRDKCRPMVEKIERARDQFSGPALGPLAWYIAVDEENESAANSALNSWGDEILLRCVVTNANDVHVMHSLGLPRPRRVELLPAKSATERAKILPEEGSDEETLVQMDLKNTLAFNAFANLLQKKEDGLLEDHADDQSVASTDKSLGAGAATGEERDGGADAEAEKAKKKKTKKKKKKKGKRRQSPSADEQSAKKKGRPRRKASPNKQKRKRAPRNGSAPGGGDTPKFDNLLGQLLEQKVRQNESKAGESTARLAKSFAEAAEVLGKNGEIKAAYANEAFEQFLDGDQLIELAKHKKAIKKARKSR